MGLAAVNCPELIALVASAFFIVRQRFSLDARHGRNVFLAPPESRGAAVHSGHPVRHVRTCLVAFLIF